MQSLSLVLNMENQINIKNFYGIFSTTKKKKNEKQQLQTLQILSSITYYLII